MPPAPKTLFFEKSHFATHLPVDYRYTRSHFWAEKRERDRLRLGFTKFATHLLGEIVDYNFDAAPQTRVEPGQVLGWVEGFKGISEVICVGRGTFCDSNPALKQETELISRTPYTEGWLYQLDGQLDGGSLAVQEYVDHLNATIDELLRQQPAQEDGSNVSGSGLT